MLSNEWKLPLNLAIGIHLLVFFGAIYLPGLLDSKPKFADIYSVSIINVADPAAAPPAAPPADPAPPAVEPQKITATPPEKSTALPLVETPPAAPPEAPPQPAISLKPLKKKVVKETPKPVDDSRQKAREQANREKLAEALRQEALLNEQARLAQEALEQEKRLLAQTPAPRPAAPAGTTQSAASGAAGSSSSLIEGQYYAALSNRLLQFWALPEYMQKQADLQATVVITINQNGTIADMFFENRSGDRVYDQFVRKTITEADPLPPIPPALKKQRLEIGLVFRPGGIQGR
jgi:colicin import membrane protein